MDRILQNAPATISATFYDQDGEIVDPATVTVTVTRADGTALKTNAATTGSGAAERDLALTATDTALLDDLTAVWTSASAGIVTTQVEVVGGFLFSIPEARTLRPLDDTGTYPTPTIKQTRITVEQALEDFCGAFVPRYAYETLDAHAGSPLRPTNRLVRRIRTLSINGTALSPSELAQVVTDGSFLYQANTDSSFYGYNARCGYTLWGTGHQTVTIGYEYGRDTPPLRVSRAALLLAKVWLVAGPVDDRTSTFSSTDGGTYSLVTPGIGGSLFGVPEVDAVAQQYGMPQVA